MPVTIGVRMPMPEPTNTTEIELERLLEENRRLKAILPIGNKATSYVWAIVILCGLALMFVVGVTVARPETDNTALITLGLGVLAPVLAALVAATIQQVHLAVNSRLTQLLKLTDIASRAEGYAAGVLVPAPGQGAAREEGRAEGVEQERVREEHK
jgi:hypothetical protein